MGERNCGTCLHRSYGDMRLISQCALKAAGDPMRDQRKRGNPHFPAPRARDFGRKCRRWTEQTEDKTPTALVLSGLPPLVKDWAETGEPK